MNPMVIIGGGVAGLALAVDLRKRGLDVLLLEKGDYPRHKVCGEYISLESWPYLTELAPGLEKHDLPLIRKFLLSALSGSSYAVDLPLGGVGLSRFVLEYELYKEAVSCGVQVITNTAVRKIGPGSGKTIIHTDTGHYCAALVFNATGRRSGLGTVRPVRKINYVGVKYHVQLDRPADRIELHSFSGGYCGISDVENRRACLCYLVRSDQRQFAGGIRRFEELVLKQNSFLRSIWENAVFEEHKPHTVSGIHFEIIKPVDNGVFTLGDAAGCIAPVTGNGMSMALRSAAQLALLVSIYSRGELTRDQLEEQYSGWWGQSYARRIRFSRYLQAIAEKPVFSGKLVSLMNALPGAGRIIIRQTHGTPFQRLA